MARIPTSNFLSLIGVLEACTGLGDAGAGGGVSVSGAGVDGGGGGISSALDEGLFSSGEYCSVDITNISYYSFPAAAM